MEFQEMKAYHKSMELVYYVFSLSRDLSGGSDGSHLAKALKNLSVNISLNVAKGGALFPEKRAAEFWELAKAGGSEMALLLDIAAEEKYIPEQGIRILDEILQDFVQEIQSLIQRRRASDFRGESEGEMGENE